MWRNDKIPYGTYYAYNNLKEIFHRAEVINSSASPVSFYEDDLPSTAYLIIGTSVRPDEKELRAILNFASSGNQVFISAIRIGDNLLDSFRLKATDNYEDLTYNPDSLTVSLFHPLSQDSFSFTYPGRRMDNHFTKVDSSITNVLGKDKKGNINFVKFTYEGGGAIFIHLAPATFTNFFLLHKNNKQYYDLTMSFMPDSIKHIRWDEYFRYHTNGNGNERSGFSKMGAFLKNPVLRWAFWLTIILFVIIYLFESKRKQKMVPIVKGLKNSSLDFVKTVGRLYYQRRDNKNLASKMAIHFLSHVRTRYNIQTSQLDDQFETMLAFKSGADKASINSIIQYIRAIVDHAEVGDSDLLSFNENIQNFYKQT
ncbi:MAG: DUF4350 domain-containing protein [Flavitalea sp.]